MRKGLFPALAWQNLRKNGRFYIPYILTVAGTVAGFYIINAIASDEGISQMTGGRTVAEMMSMGIAIISLFACIFLIYTNSFLMKRRNRELALYNILGMEKRHIAIILCWESLYVAFFGIVGGLLCGMLFHKLVTLILCKILFFDVPFGFTVSIRGIKYSLILFTIIICLTLIFNLIRIGKTKPIELLKSTEAGEREPKSKWLLALIGVAALGAGYYIALTTKTAMEAIELYFLAVFFVIVGTYFLFTAVSIVILKSMRKNKKIYYKTKYFIGISGMLYRMKQNAVGLANICILSTMVLVMLSGTLSLYLGTEDEIKRYYPGQIMVWVSMDSETENSFKKDIMIDKIKEIIEKNNGKIKEFTEYKYLTFQMGRKENSYSTAADNKYYDVKFCAITEEDYRKLTGRETDLKDNEILFYDTANKDKDKIYIEAGNYSSEFNVAEHLKSFPAIGNLDVYIADKCYVVVKDEEVLDKLYEGQKAAYNEGAELIQWFAAIETDLNEEKQIKCAEEIGNITSEDGIGYYGNLYTDSRAKNSADIYAINGSFLFLGLFLGILFIMATVLIIYYKQISEGYDDKDRFEIMQQVGLPQKEIKRSIHAQILIVFFAPLLVSAIHVAFDFKLMIKLLSLFAVNNIRLVVLCTVGTLLGFAVMYGIVYNLTARTYYKIVSAK